MLHSVRAPAGSGGAAQTNAVESQSLLCSASVAASRAIGKIGFCPTRGAEPLFQREQQTGLSIWCRSAFSGEPADVAVRANEYRISRDTRQFTDHRRGDARLPRFCHVRIASVDG